MKEREEYTKWQIWFENRCLKKGYHQSGDGQISIDAAALVMVGLNKKCV